MSEPEPAAETPRKRPPGRPTEREVPRTTLDAWIVAHESSSAKLTEACAAEAATLGIDASYVPNRKSIDDMRIARFYPGTVAMLLISRATGGEVALEQWARDLIKIGTRSRRRSV